MTFTVYNLIVSVFLPKHRNNLLCPNERHTYYRPLNHFHLLPCDACCFFFESAKHCAAPAGHGWIKQ